jgi:hypothetical protein
VKARRHQWAEFVARVGETKNTYSILMAKLLEKHALGRPQWK